MADPIEIVYPFTRTTYSPMGPDGVEREESWRPGTYYAATDNMGGGASFADGLGLMRVHEVSRHKPGRYPERVFYTREFIDPDGKVFGKRKLRMTTASAFASMCAGFRHPFSVRQHEHAQGNSAKGETKETP